MQISSFVPQNYFGSNCYLLSDSDEYAIIDPSVEYEEIISKHPEAKGKIKFILITHAHFDHIIGINSFDKDTVVYVSEKDAVSLSDPYKNCYLGFLGVHDGYYGNYKTLKEGDELSLGNIRIKVLDTPGHTVGGLSFVVENNVFVGDTLFANGGYGRCDLPGGDIEVLEKSLIKLFARFRDEIFYSGHGEPSTFKETIEYFN